MSVQLLFQNQWGPEYGRPTLTVFTFSVWWFGFQIVIFNFRIYFRIHKGNNDEY